MKASKITPGGTPRDPCPNRAEALALLAPVLERHVAEALRLKPMPQSGDMSVREWAEEATRLHLEAQAIRIAFVNAANQAAYPADAPPARREMGIGEAAAEMRARGAVDQTPLAGGARRSA
jgi:hypothetical protein